MTEKKAIENSNIWNVTPKQAVQIQREMARLVSETRDFDEIETVAGVDSSVRKGRAKAAVVVLDFGTLEVIDAAVAEGPVSFRYVPGLLTFREGPLIVEAVEKLIRKPDLIVFDGQGRAHPRRLGIASHMGVLLDIPSIGCAKKRLWGEYGEPGLEKGSVSPLTHKGEAIGSVLRTRAGVKPVFVSVGHRIDLESSVKFVLSCCRKYRLPETTREAHRLAKL